MSKLIENIAKLYGIDAAKLNIETGEGFELIKEKHSALVNNTSLSATEKAKKDVYSEISEATGIKGFDSINTFAEKYKSKLSSELEAGDEALKNQIKDLSAKNEKLTNSYDKLKNDFSASESKISEMEKSNFIRESLPSTLPKGITHKDAALLVSANVDILKSDNGFESNQRNEVGDKISALDAINAYVSEKGWDKIENTESKETPEGRGGDNKVGNKSIYQSDDAILEASEKHGWSESRTQAELRAYYKEESDFE